MNIYEPQSFEQEKIKSKKLMRLLSIALVIVFLLSICIVAYIIYLQKAQLKVYIDDAKVNIPSNMVIFDDDNNTVYISLSDIAEKIGYRMNKGEYKSKYLEDDTKCHLVNKYEAVSYIENSNEIYKAIIPENAETDTEYEYYTIDEPVFSYNNKLYTTLNGLGQGCNLSCSYNAENNKIEIYTLDYLAKYFAARVIESKEIAEQDDVNAYKNKKALLYNMAVIKDEDGRYGVNDLNNEQIIGKKYKSIEFDELMQEFIVETDDGKFGIIDKTGKTKISPEYASIKQIEKDKGLYLVSRNSNETAGRTLYGIINKNERVVVYLEYEQIGINKSDFPTNNIENQYLLYGKCIPVKKSNKWGLLDINGSTILPIEYEELGCKSNASKNTQANSLLLIPEYEAVVVTKNKGYGLYNSSGRELIQPLCTDMYTINSSGENKYYLTYQGLTMDIINYLKTAVGIEPVTGNDDGNNTNNSENTNNEQNTNSNPNTNNVQNINDNQNSSNVQDINNTQNTNNVENTNNTQDVNNNQSTNNA